MEARLTKVGNSLGFMIPSVLRKSLHLEAGQSVMLEETEQGILIRPLSRPRYTLHDLLAQCDPHKDHPQDIKDWDSMRHVGQETW